MARRPVAPRWAIGLGVSVVVGSSAVLGSRAGLASLAVGMLALIVLLWRVKLEGARALLWVPISALLGGIVLFMLAVNAGLWQSMIDEGAKKIALISWTKPVVTEFPIFGIGRGAFESVFPAYRADLGHHVYQFAENFIMQWCVEWGVPVAVVACLGFAYTLRPNLRGARSEVLALCGGVGVVVLLLQNLLDLALEVASVGLALSVLLGSLWSQPREARFDTEVPPRPASRLPPITLFGVGALLWACTAVWGIHTTFDDRRALAVLSQRYFKGDTSVSGAAHWRTHCRHRKAPRGAVLPAAGGRPQSRPERRGNDLDFPRHRAGSDGGAALPLACAGLGPKESQDAGIGRSSARGRARLQLTGRRNERCPGDDIATRRAAQRGSGGQRRYGHARSFGTSTESACFSGNHC